MGLQISIQKKSASEPLSSHKLAQMLRGVAARAGVHVNENTVLQTAAAFCAGRVLAEGIAQVPFKVYRTEEKNGLSFKHEARDHWAWDLLHHRPNDWMTSFELRELLMFHAIFRGNAYCLKNISPVDGRVMELLPLDNVTVEQQDDWSLLYTVRDKHGLVGQFDRSQILHLRGPSMDGYQGLSVIKLAREALGLSSALQNAQSRLQAKGGQPSGVLTYKKGELSKEVQARVKAQWNERYGPGGEGGIAIFDGDWEYIQTALTGADSQHIENRRFQIEEVCRFMRVFPQMVMQTSDTTTYGSAEQFFIAHVTHSLGPWYARVEQTFQRDLLSGENVECEFVVDGLMRTSAKDRADYFAKALGAGGSSAWMTQNEVRRAENRNPKEGGDELAKSMTMTAQGQSEQGKGD